MKKLKPILYILGCYLFITCSSNNNSKDQEPVLIPEASSLVFPIDNTICNEGTVISATESSVLFKWSASKNTDSYVINLLNLTTNISKSYDANTNELAVTILRGNSYSWSITSKNNGTEETAESSVWNFYNAGLPVENHVPFPASIINPSMGSSINAGTITLEWKGNDIDNDIASYEILLDTNSPPTTIIGNSTDEFINTPVTTGEIYYWKVISYDAVENSSSSEVFQFKVK